MKSLKLFAAMLLLGSTTSCSHNVAEKYWQDKVVKSLFGKEYVNLRLEVAEYSICDGKEFDIRPTVTIDIHLTPQGLYQKDHDHYKLITEDSIFVYHFQEGYYTYGRTTKLKSDLEKIIYSQLKYRNDKELHELIPFYLHPKDKKSFKVKEFSYMGGIGENPVVLRYSTRKPWKDRFYDGTPYENSESIVVWVDDSTGSITRVRRTIHMTSEGISPADDIIDIRISNISFEKEDFDESPYRKNPSKDTDIAFYNMNREEYSPAENIVSYSEVDFDGFLDAPLINTNLDTITLRGIEGWVLVDIMNFNCAPCIHFTEQMKKEQQELGYRKLEHEGFKVMCLHAHNLDPEIFKAFVERFHITDIAYSAQAIKGLINWPGVPYYILLSPDKQVVFRGHNLGKDYKNILKAKKEHSKR